MIFIGQELEIHNPEKSDNITKTAGVQKSEAKTISVTATAYTTKYDGCSGVTSTGIDLLANPNMKVML